MSNCTRGNARETSMKFLEIRITSHLNGLISAAKVHLVRRFIDNGLRFVKDEEARLRNFPSNRRIFVTFPILKFRERFPFSLTRRGGKSCDNKGTLAGVLSARRDAIRESFEKVAIIKKSRSFLRTAITRTKFGRVVSRGRKEIQEVERGVQRGLGEEKKELRESAFPWSD